MEYDGKCLNETTELPALIWPVLVIFVAVLLFLI